jgi:hypothetical protein
VTELPPPHLFSDPNDRLLASVMPAPPPPLGVRARRGLQQASSRGLRQVRRWLRRGPDSATLLLVGLASFGVAIGAYLGVATRSAPEAATLAGEARPAPLPEAILPLRANARVAAIDPIPCATGLAAPAPRDDLEDGVRERRTPAPPTVARPDDAPERKLRPEPRRHARAKHTASAKLPRSKKLARSKKLEQRSTLAPARGAKRLRAANAASLRTAQR